MMERFEVPGPWAGTLFIAPRPRGGDWLEDDLRALREQGVSLLVSLLVLSEQAEFELSQEEAVARRHGIEYVSLPIEDMGVPASASGAAQVIDRLRLALAAGKTVLVHCRQGIGRSAVIAAGVLVASGVSVSDAFDHVQAARGRPVPETAQQRAWVERFAMAIAHPRRAAS